MFAAQYITSLVSEHITVVFLLSRFKVIQVLRAVVVAQLVEQSPPIPEVRGSIPVIGKNLFIY